MIKEIKNYIGIVSKFFRDNGWWLQYLALAIIIAIGIFIRVQPLDNLIDSTTGEYISLELDSTLFYRYAQDIAQNGTLSGVDMTRYFPLGQSLGFYGLYTSYFVAYLWKFLHIFNSDITVEYVDLLYPIFAMAIMSLFFFLLLRRLLGWKTGLLATLFINVIPAFLFRSLGGSSDHDVLVIMFVVMSFYFYFVAWDSKKLRYNLLFAFIAAITSYLAMATGGSGRLVLLILGVTNLASLLLNSFEEKDFYVLVAWLLPFSLLMQLSGINLLGLFIALATVPAYFALLVAIFDFVLFKKKYFKFMDRFSKKLPSGLFAFIIALVVGSVFALIVFGVDIFIKDFSSLYNNLFHAFQYGRVGLTVAENRRPYVVDWFSQFGRLYVILFIAGAIALFYTAVKPLKELRKKLTLAFTVFIVLYIFSRYSPTSFLNGDNVFSKFVFFAVVILFSLYLLYIYIYSYYKDSDSYNTMANVDRSYLFLILWFLVMVIGATSAIRLFFEFSPTTVVLVSFFLVFVFDYFVNHKEKIVKYAGVFLVILVLFSPFSFAKGMVLDSYSQSSTQATYSGPGYNLQWQIAGKWIRENTPEDSVFVFWWDYGYWVQSGFNRATVTDGGHAIGWWDYLIARDVLTAQNLTQPLKFLKAHGVDYLLIINDEIGKYPAYSSIGGDIHGDRSSYLTTFVLDSSATQETRNGTTMLYRGGFPLDEDLVVNGKVYPAGRAGIGGVILPFINLNSTGANLGQAVGQPNLILVYNSEQVILPMKCVYIDRIYTFDDYAYDGCFRIMPFIQGNQVNNFGSGLFVSTRVVNSLFARLFLFNGQSPYYELVYDDSANMPLAIYQGNMIGPMKIWKVNYPEDLILTQEDLDYNLRTTYPDLDLTTPV